MVQGFVCRGGRAWRSVACWVGLLRLLADLVVMIADDDTTISEIENRHGAIPPARVAGGDLGGVTVIRLDASIVLAHSDKQQAGLTVRRSGFILRPPGVTTPTSRW